MVAGATEGGMIQAAVMTAVHQVGARLEALVESLSALPDDGARLIEAWVAVSGTGTGLRAVTDGLVILLIGGGVEWLFWAYAIGRARAIEAERPAGFGRALALGLERLGLRVFGVVLFSVCALGASSAFMWPPGVHDGVVALAIGLAILRLGFAEAEFWLSPHRVALRVLPLSTRHARRYFRLTMTCVALLDVAWLSEALIGRLITASSAARLVELMCGGVVAALLVQAVLRGVGDRRPRRRVSAVLPFAAATLVVLTAVSGLLGFASTALSLLLLGAFLVADRLFGAVIDRLAEMDAAPPEDGTSPGDASVPPASLAAIYRPVLRGLTRLLLALIALALGAGAWDMRVIEMTGSGGPLGRLIGGAVTALIFALAADFVWLWVKTTIDHRLAMIAPAEGGEEASGDGGAVAGPNARLATLLPLLRKAVKVVLIGFVALSGLSSLGFDIGPLLAGASVLGIAVGFGAQTLVRDIITGVFFLLEDAFRIGEYIEFGNIRGTVEGISLRSFRLRHHRGQIHTVPFGEVKSLTNYSRDWAIMKLEFRVPFDTDLRLVKRIVKQIAAELQADEELGQQLLQPLKFQGVTRMEEFSMVVGVKFMAKPGEQFTIRREAYHRIRDAFAANGIKFPDRSVRIDMAEYDGPQPPMSVLAAAADEAFGETGPLTPV